MGGGAAAYGGGGGGRAPRRRRRGRRRCTSRRRRRPRAAPPTVAAADQVAERAVARPDVAAAAAREPTSDDFPPKTGIRMPLLFEPPGLARTTTTSPCRSRRARQSYEEALLQARLDEEAVADTAVRRVVFDSETSLRRRHRPARRRNVGGGGAGNLTLPPAGRRRSRAGRFRTRCASSRGSSRATCGARRRWAHTLTSWCCAPTCRPSRTRGGSLRVRGRAEGRDVHLLDRQLLNGRCLYSSGLRPLLCRARHAAHGTGWRRCGDDLLYYPNGRRQRAGGGRRTTRSASRSARNSTATAAASPAACRTRSRRSATTSPCCATAAARHLPCAPPSGSGGRARRSRATRATSDHLEFAPPGTDADGAARWRRSDRIVGARPPGRDGSELDDARRPRLLDVAGAGGAAAAVALRLQDRAVPQPRRRRRRQPPLQPRGRRPQPPVGRAVEGAPPDDLRDQDADARAAPGPRALPVLRLPRLQAEVVFARHRLRPRTSAPRRRVLPFLLARNSGGSFSYEGCTFKLRPRKENSRAVCARQVACRWLRSRRRTLGQRRGRGAITTSRRGCSASRGALCLSSSSSATRWCAPTRSPTSPRTACADRRRVVVVGGRIGLERRRAGADERGGGAGARAARRRPPSARAPRRSATTGRGWCGRSRRAAHPPGRGAAAAAAHCRRPSARRRARSSSRALRRPAAVGRAVPQPVGPPAGHRRPQQRRAAASLSTAATAATAASRWTRPPRAESRRACDSVVFNRLRSVHFENNTQSR